MKGADAPLPPPVCVINDRGRETSRRHAPPVGGLRPIRSNQGAQASGSRHTKPSSGRHLLARSKLELLLQRGRRRPFDQADLRLELPRIEYEHQIHRRIQASPMLSLFPLLSPSPSMHN